MIEPPVRRSWRAMIVVSCYAALLFWVNHVPWKNIALGAGGGDKLAHLAAYGLLALLLAWAFFPERRAGLSQYAALLAAVGAYGALDELLQLAVPGRTGDVADWVADLAGGVGGLLLHASSAPALGRLRAALRTAAARDVE